MHERAHSGVTRGVGDQASAFGLNRAEGLLAGRLENADEVHDAVRPIDRAAHGVLIAHIGLDGMDLPDTAEWLKKVRQVGLPDRDSDPASGSRQRLHHVAPDKSGPAENRH